MKRLKEIPWPVWALFALAILIRAFNLSNMILYWDEPIHTVRIDDQPLPFVLAHNNAGALFAVLVHVLLPLGKIEIMARLPAFLFGCLLVPLIFFAGSAFFSKREGVIAAVLVTFSPFLIRFSQYARTYSVFVFFTLLTLLLLHRARESGRARAWAGYAGAALPALYTHLMGFMTLTGMSVYAAGEWIWDALIRKREGRKASRRLLLFALFTFIAAAGAVLLYLPDENVRGFLSSSVDRVARRLPFSYLATYLTDMILTTQWQASVWGFRLWLALAALGMAAALWRSRRTALLFLCYAAVPLMIFIGINPREVNIQSADRYFIFVLPVILMLAARGITALSDFMGAAVGRLSGSAAVRGRAAAAAAVLLTAAVLAGVDLRHYYLNFHRLGTLAVPKEVQTCLKAEVGADALLFYDRFPAPGLRLVLNPLTRDPRFRSSESELRAGLAGAQGRRVMLYRSVTDPREYLKESFDLWAVTEKKAIGGERIRRFTDRWPDVRIHEMNDHIAVHFPAGGGTLAESVISACTLLLELQPGPVRRSEWLLLRARARLLSGRESAGFADLALARGLPFPEDGGIRHESSAAFLILDRLFGMRPAEVSRSALDHFHHRDTAEVLFSIGEAALRRGAHDEALRAFREIGSWSPHLERAASNRIGRIAAHHMRNGDPAAAAPLFAEARRLDPDRPILDFLEAEARLAAGDPDLAHAVWRRALGSQAAGAGIRERLLSDQPLVILQRRDRGWLLIFRSPLPVTFSGDVTGSGYIEGASGDLFAPGDVLKHGRDRIRFECRTDARRIKTILIRVKPGIRLDFDLKLDGRRARDRIMIPGQATIPERVPFSLK